MPADRRRAGARVRAVLAVDLYGQCCDYDALHDVCERHDVTLLQQAAAEELGELDVVLDDEGSHPGIVAARMRAR